MARTRIRNQLLAVLMAGALVATAAACGSSKKDDTASSSNTSTQSDESTTTTKAKTSGTTTPADGMADALNKLGQGNLGQCMEIAMTYAAVTISAGFAGLGAALGGSSSSDMSQLKSDLDKASADVPSELKGDFQTISDAVSSMVSQMQGTSGNIMDPDYQSKLEQAGKAMDTPQVKQAQDNIEKYIQKTCPDYASGSSSSSSNS